MANDRQRRLMQEALDDILSEDARQELFSHLDEDESDFAEFSQLRRVHSMLSSATHERAPRRLAATIMARLGESLEAEQLQGQTSAKSSPELEISREIIAIALTLVTVATMPLLVAASWMVVHSLADPSLLTTVLQQIIGLLLLVLEILQVFLEKAQALAHSDPTTAMALLALIPVTMLAMVRYLLSDERH